MAKKKEEKKPQIPQIEIDYRRLIEEMSDDAFLFCVDLLYPISGYRVLKPEDIRRIDLLERILGFDSLIPKAERGKDQGSLNYYIGVLKKYLDLYIKCKEGSRSERYKKRAYELINTALSDEGVLRDVDDLFFIFISFFRALRPQFDEIGKQNCFVNDSFFLDLQKADAALLNEIRLHKSLSLPERTWGIGVSPIKKEDATAVKLAYINNVLFLSRGLDARGAFLLED